MNAGLFQPVRLCPLTPGGQIYICALVGRDPTTLNRLYLLCQSHTQQVVHTHDRSSCTHVRTLGQHHSRGLAGIHSIAQCSDVCDPEWILIIREIDSSLEDRRMVEQLELFVCEEVR